MLYSSAGILALIIHLIINYDVMRKTPESEIIPLRHKYRRYLYSVLAYYITDILWGLLYERHLITLTFIDTALYFYTMSASIFMWTRYVSAYLRRDNLFGRALKISGWLFLAFEIIVTTLNFFIPVLFSFDEAGVYHAEQMRYVTLTLQIIMFVLTAVYTLSVTIVSKGPMRKRHRAIGIISLAMVGFIAAQVRFPFLPMYAIGCMLACCLLHTFVLENEKEEYRGMLEQKIREGVLKGNYYDLLTGLQGMANFFKTSTIKRKALREKGHYPTFLFFDLNGMKFYNERNTFKEGDKLLQVFAGILTEEFGAENCSRLGSDKFVVYCEDEKPDDRLLKVFADWKNRNIKEAPSIRVGIYPDKKGDIPIGTACDRANIARMAIQDSFVSRFNYFDEKMQVDAEARRYIITHLDQALEEKWIKIYFQPIIRATNDRVCDEEALARWDDPERGLLSPAQFIPILEDANLIWKLDLYMVERILEKIQKQKEAGLYLVPQSINLSRADFDSCDMVEEIRKLVDQTDIPRSLLSIEITESAIGSDFEFIKEQVDRFRELGFPVWLDDFGNGYSSLDVLQSMTVDLIKFDMRFMQQFNTGDKNKIILTELVRLADGLGIDTVCEGVERKEQVDFLREIGCDKLQGYYYAKPMPLEDILKRYETGTQIGFENPDETAYYNAIDKINLYDLTSVAKEEEDNLGNYFNSLPMAIVEVRGNIARITRSNQAYRDFMQRTFGISLTGLRTSFGDSEKGTGTTLVKMLRECCEEEGGRKVFDEQTPDGSSIHSFMRRIAYNELTDTTAAVIAVLTISN